MDGSKVRIDKWTWFMLSSLMNHNHKINTKINAKHVCKSYLSKGLYIKAPFVLLECIFHKKISFALNKWMAFMSLIYSVIKKIMHNETIAKESNFFYKKEYVVFLHTHYI